MAFSGTPTHARASAGIEISAEGDSLPLTAHFAFASPTSAFAIDFFPIVHGFLNLGTGLEGSGAGLERGWPAQR